MILYTVLPEELVLAGLGTGTGESPYLPGGGDEHHFEERTIDRPFGPVKVVAERDVSGVLRVTRLLSTDVYDYLDPVIAPGRSIQGEGLSPATPTAGETPWGAWGRL